MKDFGYIAPVKKLINGGYDVATMLDKRLRRDRKHVTKLREIFEKLDGKDPIERAYTKEVEETVLEISINRTKDKLIEVTAF